MARAIIGGKEHEVECQIVLPKKYGVNVLGEREVPRATVNLGRRKPVLVRYKIHANDEAAAIRKALALAKASGAIDDYVLEPHEEKVEEEKKKPAAKAKPAPKAKAAAAAVKPATKSEATAPSDPGTETTKAARARPEATGPGMAEEARGAPKEAEAEGASKESGAAVPEADGEAKAAATEVSAPPNEGDPAEASPGGDG
ncbi:MAG: hypothetical protein D6729_02160 [Deltaproteobacteria bacterium]|nr:MAG: hypothetical protein D6729_02160 [Deltaproteobacteria bacterium]